MKQWIWVGVLLLAMAGQTVATANVWAAPQKIVTAAQVNGTWRTKSGEFKVWALGKQRLKVEFIGTYEYKYNGELMANTGSGAGIAMIEGDTAIFKPEGLDADDDCKITMKFTGGKLVVDQEGGCGFGAHVVANGTYRKVSAAKPKFNSN